MIVYQRTQYTRSAVLATFFGILLLVLVVGFLDPATALPLPGLVATFVVVSVVFLGYRSLMVTVTPSEVRLAYALGWPNKTIERSRIVAAEPLRIPWWYGAGVRRTPQGLDVEHLGPADRPDHLLRWEALPDRNGRPGRPDRGSPLSRRRSGSAPVGQPRPGMRGPLL